MVTVNAECEVVFGDPEPRRNHIGFVAAFGWKDEHERRDIRRRRKIQPAVTHEGLSCDQTRRKMRPVRKWQAQSRAPAGVGRGWRWLEGVDHADRPGGGVAFVGEGFIGFVVWFAFIQPAYS